MFDIVGLFLKLENIKKTRNKLVASKTGSSVAAASFLWLNTKLIHGHDSNLVIETNAFNIHKNLFHDDFFGEIQLHSSDIHAH